MNGFNSVFQIRFLPLDLFLKPHLTVEQMTRSMCSLKPIREQSSYIPCTCVSADEDCVSYFPCLHLSVDITVESGQVIQNVPSTREFLQMHLASTLCMIDTFQL